MRVNELAVKTDVPPHVIRHYTRIGLLKPRRDPRNQYREYPETDIDRVRFIRRAKLLGFTLSDVKSILHDADSGRSPCPEVRKIIKLRAAENRQRLAKLKRLQSRIEDAVTLWDHMPDQPPDHASLCHLIETVTQEDTV